METQRMYHYRSASPLDIEAIKRITVIAYGQYMDILTAENAEKSKRNLGNDKTYEDLFAIAKCVVCVYQNEIVGSAFLIPSGNPVNWFEKEWAYIRLVAVHPQYSGEGIGKELTKWCIETAKQNGEKTIALHTSEFQHAARHIYETFGFQKLRDLEPIFGKQYYLYTLELSNITP